jgi:hypothetical protein
MRRQPRPNGATTPAFEAAIHEWAERHGHPVWEITATDPQELAARTATAGLSWRQSTGLARPRLIIDQFIQSQPWHVLRAGAVAYWTVFPVQHCAAAAQAWIRAHGPFPRIDVALFNHGAQSSGLADAERWQGSPERANTPANCSANGHGDSPPTSLPSPERPRRYADCPTGHPGRPCR